ncbi:MAG TPA: hypothetical protein VKB51_18770 [bacterium]|nr:hypothetical protein [bacterium]
MHSSEIVLIDSVTRLGSEARDAVVIGGSHCGVYAAFVAAKAGVMAVVLNDAGLGMDDAGISGLDYLNDLGIPAAAVGHESARIGDARDCSERGVVTHMNTHAEAAGVRTGMSAREAANRLGLATGPRRPPRWPREESRFAVQLPGATRHVIVMDSASLVRPEDEGAVVVTGSHGGLLGGRPETAIKVSVFAVVYNDACIGVDRAGLSRLPALNARGIAGATVDAWSARIGDGHSMWETGVLSHVNSAAERLGGRPGMTVQAFVRLAAITKEPK